MAGPGTLVKIDPEGNITRIRCESKGGPTVKELQEAVGGYFEILGCIYENKQRMLYIYENARIMKVPPPVNPFATRIVQEYYSGGKTVDILGTVAVWVPDEKKPSRTQLAARKLDKGGDAR